VLFEVLSPSNSPLQLTRLLHEYHGVASVEHIALVSQDGPLVQLWTRAGAEWALSEIEGMGGALPLPALGATLPLAEFYEGVEFAPSAPS
jgi:Uma2 family endonuclease